MKVKVIKEQGIDEAGNKHPAPGIKDGEHECELKEVKINLGLPHLAKGLIWVLADKQSTRIAESESTVKDAVIEKFTGTGVSASIREMYLSGAEFGYSQVHIRIAELEARVAELERVLKQMGEVDIEMVTKIYDRATKTFKNHEKI